MVKGMHVLSFVVCVIWINFALPASATGYSLSLVAQGSGTVFRNPTYTSYPLNSVVSISATPNSGAYFAGWSGDVSNAANPLNINITGNLSITGSFLPYPAYTLTLVTNGQGAISLNPNNANYLSNTVVAASATPANGWVFASWVFADKLGISFNYSNPLLYTVNSNSTLTAQFGQLPAFDIQPQSITNTIGASVNLSTHSVGTGPVSYQWFFGGNIDIGANSAALTINDAQPSISGQYYVIATNVYGSATSSIITLFLTNSASPTNIISVCDEAGLRAAVAIGGWISFGCNGTITLTGPIAITKNVILDGHNFSTVISGGNSTRLFNVFPGASLSITNVTLADGSVSITNGTSVTNAEGAAVYNQGALTFTSCMLSNNTAAIFVTTNGSAFGGAIFNDGGTVNIYQSTLVSNVVVGGYYYGNLGLIYGGVGMGGAIYNNGGIVSVFNSSIFNNQLTALATYGSNGSQGGTALGGAIYNASGSLSIYSTVISNNVCVADGDGGGQSAGGAIAALSGNVLLNRVTLSENQTSSQSGSGSTTSQTTPASGGAVYNSANLTVESCTFNGNSAFANVQSILASGQVNGSGGAIYNSGNVMLAKSVIYSNWVQGSSGHIKSTVPGNGGNSLGAGIYNSGQFSATNSTIAFNTAISGSGSQVYPGLVPNPGVNGNAFGGGVYNGASSAFSAWNVTIVTNFVIATSSANYTLYGTPGQALGAQIYNNGTVLSLHNSILACSGSNSNAYGNITDDGYNMSSDGSAALFASGKSFNYTDPLLGPLADNGGSTLTMALLANSPAIDFGDPANFPATDQRGFLRPAGAGVDIGAFEYAAVPPTNNNVLYFYRINNTYGFNLQINPGMTYYLQTSGDLKTWNTIENIGSFSSPLFLALPLPTEYSTSDHRYFRLLLQ